MMIKQLIIAAGLLAGCLSADAQVLANAPKEPMQITEYHDFGTIRRGRPVTHTFQFVNNGKEPIRLENVAASCGCTTPEWSPEPVAPGKTGSVKVGYNAAVEGEFEKSITLVYNGGKTKIIYVKGKVEPPVPAVPINSSVQLLKQSN